MQSIARRQKIGRMTHWIECPNDRWIRQIVALCGNGRKNVNVRGVSVRLIDIIVQQVHINNVQGAIRIAVVPLVPHILFFGESSMCHNSYFLFSLFCIFTVFFVFYYFQIYFITMHI